MFALLTVAAGAQTAPPTAKLDSKGQVLFERSTESAPAAKVGEAKSVVTPTDAERAAVSVVAYDLDARLTPADGELAVRARVTVRNDDRQPLSLLAMQLSSTLHWESATDVSTHERLVVAEHRVDTDADHTGAANEVVLTLAKPLAPGASVVLDTFYSGTVAASAERLVRIGASAEQGAAADWDCVCEATALRGFGNVLWYPVASVPLFLGDGAKLFQAVGEKKLQDVATTMRLRVAIQYQGEPPVAMYFGGRRAELKAVSDDPTMPVATGSGLATAEFPAERLGFRLPSLFVIARAEELVAPLAAAGDVPVLAVETANLGALPRFAASAQAIAPLLERWFGPRPLSALAVIDHPGQPFEDGPLVVAPVDSLAGSDGSSALAHSLTHAWVQTGQPWMDEGLAQFVALLWAEQQHGRDAATAQLTELMRPVGLAEPAFDAAGSEEAWAVGQPLVAATDELYYRRKAGAVWWMLRDIVGDAALQQALSAWRVQPVSHDAGDVQARGFEKLLEKTSGKELGWFFHDWVLHDRGLPDLTIQAVTVQQRPAAPGGKDAGWLVSVTVTNEGAAAAEVPVVVRASASSTTQRLLVPGLDRATVRVLVESQPIEVLVNDGTVPELRAAAHSKSIVVRPE
jgi:hypothetical protein